MNVTVIQLEYFKLRRKRLFLISTGFLLVEILWLFLNMNQSIMRNPDQARWEPLIATISSMNGLFLPLLIAISVSRICDMEHKGNTWKLLLTLSVKRSRLYFAKFFVANGVMFTIAVLQMIAMIVYGILKDFADPVPVNVFMQFLIGILLTNAAIIALQQWVSFALKNQAFALALGMIGSFLGMTGGLFPFSIRRFFIWSYYNELSPVAQHFSHDQITYSLTNLPELLPLMGTVFIVAISLYIIGSFSIRKKEV